MGWDAKQGPRDNESDKDKWKFVREVHTRFGRFSYFTFDPPNVGAGATVDTTLTTTDDERLEGLREGMFVQVTPPSTGLTAGLHITAAWVPADDQLTIRLYNSTGGGINEASGTWSYAGVLP